MAEWRRKNKFSESLQVQFPMIKKSSDLHSAECLTCLKTMSIGNKGKFDKEQHLQSATHKNHAKSASGSRHLSSFLVTKQKLG
jgi:hypothetical protein